MLCNVHQDVLYRTIIIYMLLPNLEQYHQVDIEVYPTYLKIRHCTSWDY